MKDFNGKLAVVTGGASGVGFAIVRLLQKKEPKLFLLMSSKKVLRPLLQL